MSHSRKIISMESFKYKRAAEKGFREMRDLFKSFDYFDENTKWSDLPDYILLFLSEESKESELVIYELVMGASGRENLCGCTLKSLPSDILSTLMDIYFFIKDQIRFECMRRIGWVSDVPYSDKSIIEIIFDLNKRTFPGLMPPPVLTYYHPGYLENREANNLEQSGIARKYIYEAVKTFRLEIKRRNENGCS